MRDRLLQRLDITAFVEHQSGRRGVRKIPDQIAPPDFVGAEFERGGRLVHQPFDGKGDDRARHAAIGRHGAGVSGDAARHARIGTNVVGPRQFSHGHQRLDAAGGRKARIGADIGDDVARQRDQLAGCIEGAFELHMLIAAVEGGDQVFAPVLAPGDGGAQLSRQPNQKNVFGRQRHLLAETAADVGRHDAQIGFRKLQAYRQSPCGSGAAFAWCRSASRGPTPRRTPHAPRALQAASHSGGGSGPRRGRPCAPARRSRRNPRS